MAKKHFTAMGNQIDMSALAIKHSSTVALGNARMNARGDVLGNGGVVLRTQEQIEAEWKKIKDRHDASIGIGQDIKSSFPDSQPIGKKITEDQDFDPSEADNTPIVAPPVRRRKIVDAD